MLAVRLPHEIEARLDSLSKKTGRTKTFYVREAVMEHLEELEDYYLAAERSDKNLPGISIEEVERRLDLAD